MSNTGTSRIVVSLARASAVACLALLAGCASSDSGGQSSAGSSQSDGSAGQSSAGTSYSYSGGKGAGSAGAPGGDSGVAGSTSAGAGNGGGSSGTLSTSGTNSGGASTAGSSTGGAGDGIAGAGGAFLESPAGFFSGGYLMRAPWMGYTFTIVDSLGSSVAPVCNATGCTPAWGAQPCASGTVVKDANSASFAGLAFHANDPMGGPRGTWTSTGAGIYVSVSNAPETARLQLQEQVASADTRYCAPLPAGGTGLIPFSSFKTYCWGDAAHPSKVFALGTKVHEVTVMLPGNSVAAQPFDFCLVDIQPR